MVILPFIFIMTSMTDEQQKKLERLLSNGSSGVLPPLEPPKSKPDFLMPFEEFMFLMLGSENNIKPETINKGDSAYWYFLHLEKQADILSEKLNFNLREKRFQNKFGLINMVKPLGLYFVDKKVEYDFISKSGGSFAFFGKHSGSDNDGEAITKFVGALIGIWVLFSEYGKNDLLFSKNWIQNKKGEPNLYEVEGTFFNSFGWLGGNEKKDFNLERVYNFCWYMSMAFFAMLVFPKIVFDKIYKEHEEYKGNAFLEDIVEKKLQIPATWKPLIHSRLKIQRIMNRLESDEKLAFLEKL